MTTITFRSPVTIELRRRGQCSPATDAFCVTQQFSDPDFYWSKIDPAKAALGHRATDIGNFRCGYPIVAMAAGIARRVQDNAIALGAPNNALGVQIDHGSGVQTAYWHLASWSVADGAQVVAGQEIGKLGKTGLGQVCHTHIEATVNGVRIDPEPLMFGGSINTDVTSGGAEDDPMYNPKDVLSLYGLQLVTRGTTNIRPKQGTSYEKLTTLPAGVTLTAAARVVGEPANGSIEWYEIKVELGEVRVAYVHSSAVDVVPVASTAPADCTEQVKAARAEGVTAGTAVGFADAKTRARVAVEAI